MKKKSNLILQIGYCIVLLFECVALYKSKFHFYQAARLLTSVILFLLIYKGDKVRVKNLYIYIALSFVFIADLLTMFCNGFLFYVGLSLFTFSYLSIAAILYRRRVIRDRKNIPPVLYLLGITQLILMSLYYFIPNINETITVVQIIIHVVVIFIILIWAIKVYRWKKDKNWLYILVAILIIITNIIYVIDVNFLNRKYVIIDVLVVLFHGLYMLLLTISVKNSRKKEDAALQKIKQTTE